MSTTDQSMDFARALGRLYVSLRDHSYEEFERALLKFGAEQMGSVGELEALETHRRIAEELLMGAYVRNVAWPQFSGALERIRALGYTNVERQAHVACLFARWAHRRHEREDEARKALDLAEQELDRTGPSHLLGQQVRSSIEKTRMDTGYL